MAGRLPSAFRKSVAPSSQLSDQPVRVQFPTFLFSFCPHLAAVNAFGRKKLRAKPLRH
uniref:Uncharacterized protein n=1 Tax=Peronospora matthiolae TaxID=2874970 RepID=A0AAV1T2M1_9STRA